MTNIYGALGLAVKGRLLELKMDKPVRDLAALTGWSTQRTSAVLRGQQRMAMDDLLMVATLLECSPSSLIDKALLLVDEPPPAGPPSDLGAVVGDPDLQKMRKSTRKRAEPSTVKKRA